MKDVKTAVQEGRVSIIYSTAVLQEFTFLLFLAEGDIWCWNRLCSLPCQ